MTKQQRFLSLGQSFAKLESLVEIFDLAQTNQADVQSRLYEQIDHMQNNIFVARGLLADVTSSALNLQATIEGTSTRMAQIATIGGMTETVFRWGWLLLVAYLLNQFLPNTTPLATSALLGRFPLLCPLGRRISIFHACRSVFAFLVKASGFSSFCQFDMVLVHYASGTRIPLFPVFFFLATLFLATLAFYFSRQKFPTFRPSPNLASPQLDLISKTLLLSSDGRGEE